MQIDVRRNAGSKALDDAFLAQAVLDFGSREVSSLGMLAMKQCHRDPDLIANLDLRC
jgi:hypothetical protein